MTTPRNPIARGATARAAVPSRLSPAGSARRAPLKASPTVNGDSKDTLAVSLKNETNLKEQLMVQLQDKDQIIHSLTGEVDTLTSALHTAETRINEMFAEQSRSETEMAQRIEISDKLRSQVRELEKDCRDLQRRYNEQTATFEAERQAFYDNEQHLKSRIQSLIQARRQPEASHREPTNYAEPDEQEDNPLDEGIQIIHQDINDPEQEPAEMTALKLELSTLSTSHTSLQNTLVLLQTQLVDLKRVNQQLQEDNESYMILLREKTLSGQFDVMKQTGTTSFDDDDDGENDAESIIGSLRSTGRTTLDRVDEEPLADALDQQSTEFQETDSITSRGPRPRRKRTNSTNKPIKGETLADLPITGPGLDLAAELGRAENKDILNNNFVDRKDNDRQSRRNMRPSESGGLESTTSMQSVQDVDALRTEVKALKDANRALSLYASKILDRIISQEGFEHVLAVDYDRQPASASGAASPKPAPKARPQSMAVIGKSFSQPNEKISSPLSASPIVAPPSMKAQRRSLSFDWRGFSLFSGEKKAEPNLRPLTLQPGSNSVTGARKLETLEDEEDRRERERLNATMKLMGIQPSPQSPVIEKSPTSTIQASTPTTATNRRFSFFGSRSTTTPSEPDSNSTHSTPSLGGSSWTPRIMLANGQSSDLTRDALEHAEAENSLAALDAHERQLSAEIAKGANSGFTELARRSGGRRTRRSAGGSGSGSTVWSAGQDEDL